jgi:hypothetical protein
MSFWLLKTEPKELPLLPLASVRPRLRGLLFPFSVSLSRYLVNLLDTNVW